MTDSTKADLISSFIKDKMLNDIESLKTLDGRKAVFADLQTKHHETKFTKSHFLDILKREIKRINKDPREFGLSVRTPTFTKPNSSIGGKTKPKQVAPTPYPKEAPTTESGKPQTAGQPTPATQEQMQELARQIQFNFNAKNTGAMIKALYGGMKFVY